jgi:hypothetical protein
MRKKEILKHLFHAIKQDGRAGWLLSNRYHSFKVNTLHIKTVWWSIYGIKKIYVTDTDNEERGIIYCNLIDTKNRILCNDWYNHISRFTYGMANVVKGGKYNFINYEGKLLYDGWFDWVGGICIGGISAVCINKRYNFIDRNGLITSHWLSSAEIGMIYYFTYGGKRYRFSCNSFLTILEEDKDDAV